MFCKKTVNDPLSDDPFQSLLPDKLYLTIHTHEHLAGELRTQVSSDNEATFTASLTGEEGVYRVNADASGSGCFIPTESEMVYGNVLQKLKIPAAHIRKDKPVKGITLNIENKLIG